MMRSVAHTTSGRSSEVRRPATSPNILPLHSTEAAPGSETQRPNDSPHLAWLGEEPLATDSLKIGHATAGDHVSIQHFLLALTQEPTIAEYHAQLDEPSYEPYDRLLVKRNDQIVSHVHLAPRVIHVAGEMLPTCDLTSLVTMPEYRHRGLTTAVLDVADQQMEKEGAVLSRLRTSIPSYFQRRGWFPLGRHSYSLACPRDILGCLHHRRDQRQESKLNPPPDLKVRLWRHVEQDALARLYDQHACGASGVLERSEAYWRWLISRQGYDRVYVAVRGEDKQELADTSSIVAYAFMRQGRLAEVIALDQDLDASERLLERACSDAIERDEHLIRVDAPPNHPLHELMTEAGGTFHHHEADHGQVFMAKVFDPIALLRQLKPVLQSRVKLSTLPRPTELGLLWEGEKLSLKIGKRSVRLEQGKLGRSYLALETPQLAQLLLGHLDVADSVRQGRLSASTATAVRTAEVLFPMLPLWRPPLDDLPAM